MKFSSVGNNCLRGISIIVFILGILVLSSNPVAGADLTEDNYLRTSGRVLRNDNGAGRRVVLHGTNVGGWLLLEPWMTPIDVKDDWTMRQTLENRFGVSGKNDLINTYQNAWFNTDDLDKLEEMGVNHIRLPIYYRNVMYENGDWKRDSEGNIDWGPIDWVVQEAGKRGIYVILDLHGAPGSQNGRDHSGREGSARLFWDNTTGQDYRDMTVKFWTEMARHFKGEPAVAGYDILNEPTGADTDQELWELYDRIYENIRSVDPHHVIFMGMAWWFSNLPNPSTYDWEDVVYEPHWYDFNSLNDFEGQKGFLEPRIDEAEARLANYEVPVYIGEFSCFETADTWEYYFEAFHSHSWSWAMWTYKVDHVPDSSWGVYTSTDPNDPSIEDDSYEVLESKWSEYNSETSFTYNDLVGPLVENACETAESGGGLDGLGWTLPGIVEAEDYNTGGEGIGYHDTTDGNEGGVYRDDDVDIEECTDENGRYSVFNTEAGEWLEYSVTVPWSGEYDIGLRVYAPEGGSLRMELGDENVTGSITLPSTEDWTTVWIENVYLREADDIWERDNIMRIYIEDGGFEVNYVNITGAPGDQYDSGEVSADNEFVVFDDSGLFSGYTWTGVWGDVTNYSLDNTSGSAPEGGEYATLEKTTTTNGWGGWSGDYGEGNPQDFSNFSNGQLEFWIKSPKDVLVGLSDTVSEGHGDNTFRISRYGWDGTDSWQQLSIPIRDFDVDLSNINDPILVKTDGTSGTFTFHFDNVVWRGGEEKEDTGSITGTVTDSDTGRGIEDATVEIEGTTYSATTDTNGEYTITDVPLGTHDVTANHDNYTEATKTITIESAGDTITQDFNLNAPKGDIDSRGFPIVWVGLALAVLAIAILIFLGRRKTQKTMEKATTQGSMYILNLL